MTFPWLSRMVSNFRIFHDRGNPAYEHWRGSSHIKSFSHQKNTTQLTFFCNQFPRYDSAVLFWSLCVVRMMKEYHERQAFLRQLLQENKRQNICTTMLIYWVKFGKIQVLATGRGEPRGGSPPKKFGGVFPLVFPTVNRIYLSILKRDLPYERDALIVGPRLEHVVSCEVTCIRNVRRVWLKSRETRKHELLFVNINQRKTGSQYTFPQRLVQSNFRSSE